MRGSTPAVVVALVVALGAAPAGDNRQIAAEIQRLTTAAPAVLPDDSKAAILSRLQRAEGALAKGHNYLALYDLQVVFEAEGGYRLASTEKDYPTQEGFVHKWTEMGPPAAPPARKADVRFVEALAQSAEGRAPATYRASRPFAADAGRPAGLYYLGESHAMVRFAALCRGLELPLAPKPTAALSSIEGPLASFESTVVKAYDATAADRRPRFAAVNVAIKLARTLDEQGRHEGALLHYLVSRHRYAMIETTGKPEPNIEALRARLAGVTLPPGADHSIGEFFLQLALASLNGPEPTAHSAAVTLDDVVPAYLMVTNKK